MVDASKVDGDYIASKQYKLEKKIFYLHRNKFLKLNLNRQTLNNYFVNIYNLRWGKPSFLENFMKYKKQIIKNNNKYLILKKYENFDLDDIDDWKIAEAVFEKYEK